VLGDDGQGVACAVLLGGNVGAGGRREQASKPISLLRGQRRRGRAHAPNVFGDPALGERSSTAVRVGGPVAGGTARRGDLAA